MLQRLKEAKALPTNGKNRNHELSPMNTEDHLLCSIVEGLAAGYGLGTLAKSNQTLVT